MKAYWADCAFCRARSAITRISEASCDSLIQATLADSSTWSIRPSISVDTDTVRGGFVTVKSAISCSVSVSA
ncbi:Uncharacterised protein [Mycobacterium tuberculosis]|nr:Uncharacterised protein [Mycobacterium tuberculosis]CKP20986.1 Uncharacterised protein [Mycobacterium tuberculosis]COW79136.1 Uncharacterised protein [Mycobacterium tuberculosis]